MLSCLDVPEDTGHVTTGGENLIVGQKSTAAEIAGVAGELPGDAHSSIAIFQTKHVVLDMVGVVGWGDVGTYLYIEQILSNPPHATKPPEGA